MIFIISIKKGKALTIYLQIFLLDKLKNRDKNIIKSFPLIYKIIIKNDWQQFFPDNTDIIIYKNIARIGVDIPEIKFVI